MTEVTKIVEMAVALEREACAQVAFSWNTAITDQIAAEIRKLKDKIK